MGWSFFAVLLLFEHLFCLCSYIVGNLEICGIVGLVSFINAGDGFLIVCVSFCQVVLLKL